MRPVLVAKGIDPDTEGRDLARYLVDELHARLMALAAARPRFQVVDMRARVAGGQRALVRRDPPERYGIPATGG